MSGDYSGTSGKDGLELGEFLRSRRARITPAQAGFSAPSGNRRVPGLRREEVAQLAGLSVEYYVRLERGRSLNASEAVLDALARVLCLDATERDHLFTVARPTRARRRPIRPQRVRPKLQRLLVILAEAHTPALVMGRRRDVLASNTLHNALFTDFDALPHHERNIVRYIFLDKAARDLYDDWEHTARGVVASLRLYAGRNPQDPQLAELIGDLSVRDEDFRRWWADHDVLRPTHGTKHYHHPVVGDLALDYEALILADDPDLQIGLYTAEPGSTSERALLLLASRSTPPHHPL
jgi:transcriptional regulator with XRE-family HTH domain